MRRPPGRGCRSSTRRTAAGSAPARWPGGCRARRRPRSARSRRCACRPPVAPSDAVACHVEVSDDGAGGGTACGERSRTVRRTFQGLHAARTAPVTGRRVTFGGSAIPFVSSRVEPATRGGSQHMSDTIAIYGAHWCPDCRRAKKLPRRPAGRRSSGTTSRASPTAATHRAGAERRQQHHPDDRLPGRFASVRAHERGARREARSRAQRDAARLRPHRVGRRPGRPHDVDLRRAREPRDPDRSTPRASAGRRASPSGSTTTRGSPTASGARSSPTGSCGRPSATGSRCCRPSRSPDPERRRAELDVETATGDHYHARAVLIATGSTYRRTEAPGRGGPDRRRHPLLRDLRRPVLQGRDELVVLGGGNSGLEEGLFLTQFVDTVTGRYQRGAR